MNSPFVTFEEARLNHLRHGMTSTFAEKISWLEEACDLAESMRKSRFSKGLAVSDGSGRIVWNERQYLNIPEDAIVSGLD